MRRLVAGVAVLLFLAALFYPLRPSLQQGILGPVGQILFVYLLCGWLFILVGVDPTGAGAVFAFFSPWPSINILMALLVLMRPGYRCRVWLQAGAVLLALFSCFVAWQLADVVSTIPLILWSAACVVAAWAVMPPIQRADG